MNDCSMIQMFGWRFYDLRILTKTALLGTAWRLVEVPWLPPRRRNGTALELWTNVKQLPRIQIRRLRTRHLGIGAVRHSSDSMDFAGHSQVGWLIDIENQLMAHSLEQQEWSMYDYNYESMDDDS